MRHGKKFNHLSRKTAHRKAMLSNMACSLIEHKRINTTVAKAKALRQYVEPLISKSKVDSTHNRRTTFKYLKNKYAVTELFREVAPKIADRPGGYTRIVRTGYRLGDNADMCLIELVDFNTLYTSGDDVAKKSKRTRRGGAKKVSSDVGAAAAAATSKVKEVAGDVASKAADVKDAVAEKAADAAETVADKVEGVKEAASEKVADAKEAASEVVDKAADKAGDIKDAAADKLADAKDAVEDKVEDLKDKADDLADDEDKA